MFLIFSDLRLSLWTIFDTNYVLIYFNLMQRDKSRVRAALSCMRIFDFKCWQSSLLKALIIWKLAYVFLTENDTGFFNLDWICTLEQIQNEKIFTPKCQLCVSEIGRFWLRQTAWYWLQHCSCSNPITQQDCELQLRSFCFVFRRKNAPKHFRLAKKHRKTKRTGSHCRTKNDATTAYVT